MSEQQSKTIHAEGAPHSGITTNASADKSAEIATVLSAIAEMMAQSDRRQTAALQTMQDRINLLSENTQKAGANVPGEFRGAFRQIEEAMELLASRIAAGSHNAVQPDVAELMTSRPVTTQQDQIQSVPATAPEASAGHHEALSRLAEMLAAGTATDEPQSESEPGEQPDEQSVAHAPQVDEAVAEASTPEAIAEQQESPEPIDPAGNPDEPWDNDSAEKLMQLYENGEAGLPAPPAATTAAPTAPAAEIEVEVDIETPEAAPTTVVPAAISDDDRGWLNGQFEDMRTMLASQPRTMASPDKQWLNEQFTRITSSLMQELSRPDNSGMILENIDERLSAMEQHVLSAIAQLDSGQDAASLKDVEACILDFSAQLESSQAELSRLATLEDDVRQLALRLSEERLQSLAAVPAPAAPSIDVDQIAKVVARQVADQSAARFAEFTPEASEPDDQTLEVLNGVKGLLNNLIIEQRNEGKQTTDRLDTLHQNIERLLNRVDKLETAPLPTAAPAPDFMAQQPAAQPMTAQPQKLASMPHELSETPSLKAPQQPLRDAPPAAPTTITEPAVAAPQQAEAAAEPKSAGRNFLADARRAAAQANARMQQDQEQSTKPKQTKGNVESLEEAAKATRADKQQPPAKSAQSSSRLRLAIAAAAIIAIGLGAGNLVFGWSDSFQQQTAATKAEGPAKPNADREKKAGTTGSQIKQPAGSETNLVTPQTRKTVSLTKDGLPSGVALTPAAQSLSAERIKRFERAQEKAALSTKVGASQPVATAIPASLIPSESARPAVRTISSNGSSPLDQNLPSALVGPLSLRLAAANGDPSASFEVGARFAEGKGVPQDFREAAKWYGKSAAKGFALAQYRLATLHERGLGMNTDLPRAKIWYERAARQGNVKAMHNLAVLLAGGKIGATDYGAAARWFDEAAARGLADSQFNLAILYENGLGVSKDLKQAYTWFALASRSGDGAADKRRRGLIGKLDASAVADADAKVASWRRRPVSRLSNDAHFAGSRWQQTSQKKRS